MKVAMTSMSRSWSDFLGGRASLAPNTMAVKSVREAAAVCMLIDEFYRLLESMGAVGRDRVMSREQLLELLG